MIRPLSAALLLLTGGLFTTMSRAQALPTAVQGLRVQTYALVSTVQPAFGTNQTNFGATAGLDVGAFHLSRHFDPSLDLRFLGSTGTVSTQLFLGGGPRLTMDFGAIKPFGEVLYGAGTIHFPNSRDPGYTHDNSPVLAYGGGVDLPLHGGFALRVEALGQRWQLGSRSVPFYPVAVSVGVRYQLHLSRRGDPGL